MSKKIEECQPTFEDYIFEILDEFLCRIDTRGYDVQAACKCIRSIIKNMDIVTTLKFIDILKDYGSDTTEHR